MCALFWASQREQHCRVGREGVGRLAVESCDRDDRFWHGKQPNGDFQQGVGAWPACSLQTWKMYLPRPSTVYRRLHLAKAFDCSHRKRLQVIFSTAITCEKVLRSICTHANISINFCNNLREVQAELDPQATALLLRWAYYSEDKVLLSFLAGRTSQHGGTLPTSCSTASLCWSRRCWRCKANSSTRITTKHSLRSKQGTGLWSQML